MTNLIIRFFTILTVILIGNTAVTDLYSQIVFWSAILVFGIPHGSIDHLVSLKKIPKPYYMFPKEFAIRYLGFILLMVIGWIIAPNLIFILFILLSSYHFGQSQLFDINRGNKKHVLYLSWGLLVISALFYFNSFEVYEIITSFLSYNLITPYNFDIICLNLLIFSIFTLVFTLVLFVIDGDISKNRLIIEFLDLSLIILLFKYAPLLISFGIYFGLWHSLKVMSTEYHVLKDSVDTPFTTRSFILALLPTSLISILGMMVLIGVGILLNNHISPIMLFVIGVSSLTLPHAISMEFMYKKALT